MPKSGHVTITKLKICILEEKFTDSKNGILFDPRRKITKLSRKNRFRTMVACRRLWRFQHASSRRTKHRSRILSYSFDLHGCLHKYKRLACRLCGNALEKFAVKFPKNADLDWSKSQVMMSSRL